MNKLCLKVGYFMKMKENFPKWLKKIKKLCMNFSIDLSLSTYSRDVLALVVFTRTLDSSTVGLSSSALSQKRTHTNRFTSLSG